MFYVYVLKSPVHGQIYIGYTADLRTRFKAHQEREGRRGWVLVYYEAYRNEKDARKREQMLKHYGNAKQSLLKRLEISLKDCDPLEGVE